MDKPKPFILPKGGFKPLSAKKVIRGFELDAARTHDESSVRKLFKGIRKDGMWELGELAMTKKGLKLIAKVLRKHYRGEWKKIKAVVQDIVAESPKQRRGGRKKP